jgi:alpha-glucoside transport system permease protein
MVFFLVLAELFLSRLPPRWRGKLRPWFWLFPALFLLSFYLIFPTIMTFVYSFFSADSSKFVGLENYAFSFTDPSMLTAFGNNLLWLVLFTLGTVLFGLIIAVLADRVRYESVVKSFIFLPMAISFVAASIIWKLMYQFQPLGTPQTGTINALLVALIPGFRPQAWLYNTDFNNYALILVGVWVWTGFCMVVLSAGLKGIPVELMEAARVDGATEWQVFRHITLPSLAPTITVVAITMIINVLKVFDIVYVLTNGNLGTEVIANRMYKELYNYWNTGHASAIAVILLLAVIPVIIYNFRRSKSGA